MSNGTSALPSPIPTNFPGYGELDELGSNWRIKFYDADGTPLSMLSFEVIDFGAISFKEIFQNVKTILATPLYSAALERLLGVDQTIVDRPIGQAAGATVAVLDALYFWEPRVRVVNIGFASDVISGHLVCNLQLQITNVIYGTDTTYDRNNIFSVVPPTQEDQMIPGPPGPPGPAGAAGPRGTQWFLGTVDPTVAPPPPTSGPGNIKIVPQAGDIYMNTVTGDIWQFQIDSTTSLQAWRKQPTK